MTKLEFISAFREACDSLPTELLETALADYERQFTDQFLSGLSEHAIVERWGSPQNAALKLKLQTLNGSFKQPVKADKAARVLISGVWLAILDLFAFIPAVIFSSLLCAFYAVSLCIYLSGIFVSASSLTGVSYIEIPAQYLPMHIASHLDIGRIHFRPEGGFFDDGDNDGTSEDVVIGINKTAESGDKGNVAVNADQHNSRYESVDIVSHLPKNTFWNGIGITLAGMIMLVLCFLATRLGFRLLRSFAMWQFTTLKNA